MTANNIEELKLTAAASTLAQVKNLHNSSFIQLALSLRARTCIDNDPHYYINRLNSNQATHADVIKEILGTPPDSAYAKPTLTHRTPADEGSKKMACLQSIADRLPKTLYTGNDGSPKLGNKSLHAPIASPLEKMGRFFAGNQ